jgi:cyclopropane-fatty-acyl-phospholipid synthase
VTALRSGLYTGKLMHARRAPATNTFRYSVCFYLLDLDELHELDRRLALFSYNGRNLVTLHDSDHMGDPDRPIKENVLAFLAENGVSLEDGRIMMLTNLRVAGYVFNPVSYFYCYRADGSLAGIVAEVSNTFGERHAYMLDGRNQIDSGPRLAYRTPKKMHVSPFFGLEQTYEFAFTEPGDRVYAGVFLDENGGRPFTAALNGARHEMTNRTLGRALLRYPFMPWQVIGLIHVQAFKLWRKRVPFHPKPDFRPGEGSISVNGSHRAATARRGLKPAPKVRRTPLAPAARKAMMWALSRPAIGEIRLRMPHGTVHRFGDASTGPSVLLTINRKDFFHRIATRGRIGIGESYAVGDWDSDDLPGLMEILARTAEESRKRPPGSLLVRAQERRPRRSSRNPPARARTDIGYHYDLGNDLYRLFLDETMTYSCAYFEHEGQSLADAQRAKYRRMAEKLELSSGDRVLEIGCGWGGFALYAAGECGAHVTGVTLSEEQAELARQRAADAGLSDQIDIQLVDYRSLTGQFDAIASIEMLEAVGEAGLDEFFAACDRLMTPGGRACIQTIAIPDQRFERFKRTRDWIQEYIFPGSLIPSMEAVVRAMSRSSELIVEGVENIGYGYADTLRMWRERFLANEAEVRALGFDSEFVRGWTFYLAFCEAAFRTRALHDYQMVLSRPFNDSLPRHPREKVAF